MASERNFVRYTRFGQTDLKVSRVCFGTRRFGAERGSAEEDLRNAMRRALGLGINFFYTALAYGSGAPEKLVGAALEPEIRNRRDEVILATKGGLRMEGNRMLRDSSPGWLRQSVEDSLRFLGTDYIDLYQVHYWPDLETPFEETAGALQEMVDEGKMRYVGLSNFSVSLMAEFEKMRKIDSLQLPYHLFRREIEEEILPYCQENGIGMLVYGSLAHGLLSGKMSPDQGLYEDDWHSQSALFQAENVRRNLEVVEQLKCFADECGHTVAQLAVAWTLANPAVDVAIGSGRRPDHIEGTAPAAEFDLSPQDLREIEEIMSGAVAVGAPYPEGV